MSFGHSSSGRWVYTFTVTDAVTVASPVGLYDRPGLLSPQREQLFMAGNYGPLRRYVQHATARRAVLQEIFRMDMAPEANTKRLSWFSSLKERRAAFIRVLEYGQLR
jgi:hypothetical protein